MYVIKDEDRGLFLTVLDAERFVWVPTADEATQFETRDEAVAAATTYGICTCWVVAI